MTDIFCGPGCRCLAGRVLDGRVWSIGELAWVDYAGAMEVAGATIHGCWKAATR